jgi:IclR family acetate operon transcriptional repressor
MARADSIKTMARPRYRRADRSGPRIQSIGRAGALLEALAAAPADWVTLAQASRTVGLHKTTAFNLLNSMVAVGLVERDANRGAYRLGLRHLEYGRLVQRRLDLMPVIRPTLVQLCADTRETVNLALPRAADAVIVESLEGSQGLRVTSYVGTRATYHSTACGRAIFAHLPEPVRQAIYQSQPLKPVTPNTVTDPARLERILAEARKRGYAVEREENEVGACCVAAPIFNAFDEVAGAVSLAGPVNRMTDERIAVLGPLLAQAMLKVSAAVGHRRAAA